MDTRTAMRLTGCVTLVALFLGSTEVEFHFFRNLFSGGPPAQRELAMQVLGEYLASRYPGKQAVVLGNPFAQKPGQPRTVARFERAELRGLRRGLGNEVSLEAIVWPELRPGLLDKPQAAVIDPHSTTPLSYMVSDGALDQVAQQHPGARILVSLIGLPVNIRQTQIWNADSGWSFALLLPDLRMLGDQSAIRQAFLNGKLAAIVLNKPGAPPEVLPLGSDTKLEFKRRFLLVTPENVDRYLQIYPRLF